MKPTVHQFIETWRSRGDEKSDTQQFWTDLLQRVYGVEHTETFIHFEQRVKLKNVSFIDASIPSTHVLIEQKSSDVDLLKPIHQSDGSDLTPFQQAERYNNRLPYSQRCRWIIVCNFREFHVHNMETPDAPPVVLKLENLENEAHVLNFMVDETQTEAYRETQLSISAGELVGKLYDALLAQYRDPTSPETLRSLNVLCVRLVFCFYAEDAGILGKHNCVCAYLSKCKNDMRRALIDLFRILNQKPEERDPYLDEDLLAFPYVNGGLFEGDVEIPRITTGIADLLTRDCSRDFDWSGISPTIFGAVFESTLNPETRRSGGMHYTSIENIHRVIDPLFLDDLRTELKEIFAIPIEKTREKRLKEFHARLASLTFFDPACGSGNFLTETYVSIRRLENDIFRALINGQMQMSESAIQVGIDQFYGIEINDFAVSVARTALWIAESQMLKETEGIINRTLDFLPLRTHANIVEGNALRLNWETVVPKDRLSFIMGNPPFVGYSLQSPEQKEEILSIYVDEKGKPYKTAGKIDYVSAWYFKAAQMISGTPIRVAFVSTNSITQGEQVASVWKPLFERFGIQIDFAWRTFRWDSEAKILAHVHCVIVGFSQQEVSPERGGGPEGRRGSENEESPSLGQNPPASLRSAAPLSVGPLKHVPVIYDEEGKGTPAKIINPYLIDAPMVFIESRNKPICGVPEMTTGNRPADGGHLIIEANEYDEFIRKEPGALPYIKKLVGSEEFINNKKRWCLWLPGASPSEIRKLPEVMKRIEACRQDRLNSPDAGRRKLAQTPTLFRETNNPESFILVPATSSERRFYLPMAFLGSDTISTNANLIIPNATLYHFGVLTSSVHMAWMRAVCGRLKSDYRYSKDIVYNNFPWPLAQEASPERGGAPEGRRGSEIAESPSLGLNPPASLRSAAPLSGGPLNAAIERTAQGILDARALYPDCSLADLYDENTMPAELRNAHKANDQAVLAAYGFPKNITEPEIVAELMKMYEKLTIERR